MKSETHRRKKKEMKVAVAMGGSRATSSPCGARCAHHEEKTRRTLEKSLTSAHPVATSLRVDWGWASGGWRAEPTPTSTLHKRKHFTTGVFRTEFNERGRGNGEGLERGKQKPVWEIVSMRSGVNAYQKKKKGHVATGGNTCCYGARGILQADRAVECFHPSILHKLAAAAHAPWPTRAVSRMRMHLPWAGKGRWDGEGGDRWCHRAFES